MSEPWAVGLTELGDRGPHLKWASGMPRGQCTHGTVSPGPALPPRALGLGASSPDETCFFKQTNVSAFYHSDSVFPQF